MSFLQLRGRHESRCALVAWLLFAAPAAAFDHEVSTTAEFSAALAAAQPGDSILLAPGSYAGGHYRHGLSGVTIRSQDPQDPARIVGGGNGIQLSDATSVVLEHLVFEQQTGNGLNIDDGGSFDTPSTDVTIRNVVVADMNASGNNDGIKLSGVTGFLVDGVRVTNWGAGGSAIDPVGCHHGLIQNSWFQSDVASGGSAVRPKGGSKAITIRANVVELPPGAGRGIQAGGSTGGQFFRFIDGDSGYEAAEIRVEGNRIIGGSSAISWVNIDGGLFHRNYLSQPGDWAFRLLNENAGQPIVETQNGAMTDNIVVFNGDSWRRAGNYDGPGVQEETFTFARNQWLNLDDPTPAGSIPQLPTPEADGVYGAAPAAGVLETLRWDFGWGAWVLPDPSAESVAVADHAGLLVATPQQDGVFDPLLDEPLAGGWDFAPAQPTLPTDGLRPIILVRPDFTGVASPPSDYNRSGAVDLQDYQLWRSQYGAIGPALADGNGDGLVDAADYTRWRDALAAASAASGVPAPSGAALAAAAACVGLAQRR